MSAIGREGIDMPAGFGLRFPIGEIPYWSSRYSYEDAAEIQAIGTAAGRRGWYTRDEFLIVMLWKTVRTKRLCEENSDEAVVAATTLALRTDDERTRIAALTSLRGIAYPTASTLLHFARPDSFPIMDVRALWALGVDERPSFYSFHFWLDYVMACRSLSREAGTSLRTLDRALWQFSKEIQPPMSTGRQRSNRLPVVGSGSSKSGSNKSEAMRSGYEEGRSVAEVARSMGVAYGFAYGVHKRWLASKGATGGTATDQDAGLGG